MADPAARAPLAKPVQAQQNGQNASRCISFTSVSKTLGRNNTEVVDADLSQYFDTIPHGPLMQSVARRIVDRHMLRLLKMWLEAPVEIRTTTGARRLTGGKRHKRGTPQGGVISPLLANLYMNRLQ
ncbi:reverse transcriptase domain-containing protein [Phaeobacter italicus]|uniref:reverse transcriptase domain-containing protein n=1 Tax=Phaeobacter italicus TaxID=481446 RepID=UPI00248DD1FA|nr:reverse transcriptase domain-containing protein [Phaeobacter italicus]